jgi:hypothetical protein
MMGHRDLGLVGEIVRLAPPPALVKGSKSLRRGRGRLDALDVGGV